MRVRLRQASSCGGASSAQLPSGFRSSLSLEWNDDCRARAARLRRYSCRTKAPLAQTAERLHGNHPPICGVRLAKTPLRPRTKSAQLFAEVAGPNRLLELTLDTVFKVVLQDAGLTGNSPIRRFAQIAPPQIVATEGAGRPRRASPVGRTALRPM